MKKKKKPEIKDERKQKFIEECAKGVKPYRAALNAGYSEKTAKVKSCKMVRDELDKINELNAIKQEAIQKEFKYTALDSFRKFQEIQDLALLPDEKGHYNNLTAAAKCEENKAKLFGAFAVDNEQKKPDNLLIEVVTKKDDDD